MVELFFSVSQNHEEKEPFGPGCRDYFWLICHLIDGIAKEDVELSWEEVCHTIPMCHSLLLLTYAI